MYVACTFKNDVILAQYQMRVIIPRCVSVGSVLLPATVSKQLLLFLNKAFTNHHHPLLQVIG